MRLFVILTATLALGGCLTGAEKQYGQMTDLLERADRERATCRNNRTQKPYRTVLATRIWFENEEPPPSFYNNEEKASDAQLAAIDQLAQDSLSCEKTYHGALAPEYPALGAVVEENIAARRDLFIELLERQISFVQFHEKSKAIEKEYKQAWQHAYRGVIAELDKIHKEQLSAMGSAHSYIQKASVEPAKAGKGSTDDARPPPPSPHAEKEQAARRCFDAIAGKPYGAQLSGKLWYSATGVAPPLSYFTINERASDADTPAIEAFAQDLLICMQAKFDWLTSHPAQRPIADRHLNDLRNIFIDLIGRKITFGEFHRQHQDLIIRTQQAWEQQLQVMRQEHRAWVSDMRKRRAEDEARKAAQEAADRAVAESMYRAPTTTHCIDTVTGIICNTK